MPISLSGQGGVLKGTPSDHRGDFVTSYEADIHVSNNPSLGRSKCDPDPGLHKQLNQ